MKFKEFIGIDVSKLKLDVFIYSKKIHKVFDNNQSGYEKIIQWIRSHICCDMNQVLFAFEHTGLYCLHLSLFLDEKQYAFTLLPGLELKRSRGIVRGKDDKTDARAITEYAYEKKEKIKLYRMPSEILLKLKRLASYREKLVKERAGFKSRLKEYKLFLAPKENATLFDSHEKMIALINDQIKKVEKELVKLIKSDEKIYRQYKLINTIKGVGSKTALMMIILTNGFTRFESWRKFASYAGIAPFPHESGNFKGKTKTSHLANKKIKSLLNNCATSAIQYSHEMLLYHQRRIAEGKNKMSTKNVVRNKLLSRIFAVVKRGTPYVDTYKYAG